MLKNRSIPQCTVIPELGYPDVAEAVAWLTEAFGFRLRLEIGNHRAQMKIGDGALVVMEQRSPGQAGEHHCDRARQRGARILRPPTDYPFGERQYTAEDFAGHSWTFSESIADVAPEEWGGTSIEL
jgi:uncharacterized glyoxalase superfamily protein PhnB